jgi:hypothetical protein
MRSVAKDIFSNLTFPRTQNFKTAQLLTEGRADIGLNSASTTPLAPPPVAPPTPAPTKEPAKPTIVPAPAPIIQPMPSVPIPRPCTRPGPNRPIQPGICPIR